MFGIFITYLACSLFCFWLRRSDRATHGGGGGG
eukprot:COSAG01_NODE_2597_length_7400_cov_37.453363_1_plen_32_part_10